MLVGICLPHSFNKSFKTITSPRISHEEEFRFNVDTIMGDRGAVPQFGDYRSSINYFKTLPKPYLFTSLCFFLTFKIEYLVLFVKCLANLGVFLRKTFSSY